MFDVSILAVTNLRDLSFSLMCRKKAFLLNVWMLVLVLQEKNLKEKAFATQSTKTFSLEIKMTWTTLWTITLKQVCLLNMYVFYEFLI